MQASWLPIKTPKLTSPFQDCRMRSYLGEFVVLYLMDIFEEYHSQRFNDDASPTLLHATWLRPHTRPGGSKLFRKGPNGKYLSLSRPYGLCQTTTLLHVAQKQLNKYLNKWWGWVPIKLYLQKTGGRKTNLAQRSKFEELTYRLLIHVTGQSNPSANVKHECSRH